MTPTDLDGLIAKVKECALNNLSGPWEYDWPQLLAALEDHKRLLTSLPRTADGVTVVPGADDVYRVHEGGGIQCNKTWSGKMPVFNSPGHVYTEAMNPALCYSTRAAAESDRAKDTTP